MKGANNFNQNVERNKIINHLSKLLAILKNYFKAYRLLYYLQTSLLEITVINVILLI